MTVDGFNLLHQFAQARQIIHFRFILQMIGIQSRMVHHCFYNLFSSSNRQKVFTRSYHFHSGFLCSVKRLQCCLQIIIPSQININAGCFHYRKFLQRLVRFHPSPCYNRELPISCRDIGVALNNLYFLCLHPIRYHTKYSRTSGSRIRTCSNCHFSVPAPFNRRNGSPRLIGLVNKFPLRIRLYRINFRKPVIADLQLPQISGNRERGFLRIHRTRHQYHWQHRKKECNQQLLTICFH